MPVVYASPMADSELTPEDVARRLEEGCQLVDVRPDEAQDGSRIAGDRRIEFEELTARAGEIAPDSAVVFYCRTGKRSQMAADAFRGSGHDAYHLAGGIEAWKAAGLSVEQTG
jgi:rhodanese-related sulfurtransferase